MLVELVSPRVNNTRFYYLLLVSRSQTGFFSLCHWVGRKKGPLPNDTEKRAVWPRKTNVKSGFYLAFQPTR